MNVLLTSNLPAVYHAALSQLLATASPTAQAWLNPSSPTVRWIVLGSLVALALVAMRLTQVAARRWQMGPNGLFVGLCRRHRLRWSDCWLLWHVAQYYRMADPARIFVEPEHFEPAGLPPRLVGRAARLAELRDRLFYVPSPPAKEQSPAFTEPAVPASPAPGAPNPPLFVPSAHPTLEIDSPISSGAPNPIGGA